MLYYSVHGRFSSNGQWEQIAPRVKIKKTEWSFLFLSGKKTELCCAEGIRHQEMALNIAHDHMGDEYQDIIIRGWDWVSYSDCTVLKPFRVWENGKWVDHEPATNQFTTCIQGRGNWEIQDKDITVDGCNLKIGSNHFRLLNSKEQNT